MTSTAPIIAVTGGLIALALGVLWYARRAARCARRSRWAGATAVFLAGGALLAALLLVLNGGRRSLGTPAAPSERTVLPVSAAAPQAGKRADADLSGETQRRIVGVWTDDYQGTRTMDLRPDGSATMDVELQGAVATLFGKRLRFDMLWRIENGCLIKESTGGQPKEKVELILRTLGRRVTESILELTDDQLRTLDPDGQTTYVWKRVR